MPRNRRQRRNRQTSRSQPNVSPGGLATHAYQPLSKTDIKRIHEASLQVLEQTGIVVEDSEAREIFEAGGATVDRDAGRVYIPRKMVKDALEIACNNFILAGRNPVHDMEMGGEKVYMGTGGAAIKVLDLHGQVRRTVLSDIAEIARLVDALNNIHFFLRPCVAHDVPTDLLDVNKTYTALANTTKHVMTNAYNVDSVREVIDMVSMVAGSKQAYEDRPIVSFVTSWTVSPLRYAMETVEVLIELVKQNIRLRYHLLHKVGQPHRLRWQERLYKLMPKN